MKTRSLLLVAAAFVASAAFAASYYDAIQKDSDEPLPTKQFKQLENAAIKDFSSADHYHQLAMAFGETTEKVWAIVYGEVFCNLTQDDSLRDEMGRNMFEWFANAIEFGDGKMSVDLTHHAQLSRSGEPPFGTSFEFSVVFGALGNAELDPVTISGLAKLRRKQLSIWNQKQNPTEVTRWQQSIVEASHFEAYNYWLFGHARPSEFQSWLSSHQVAYQSWLEWRAKNAMQLTGSGFHRLRWAG